MPRTMRLDVFHGLVALVAVTVAVVLFQFLFRWPWTGTFLLVGWLLGTTLVAFVYYGYDKRQAQMGGRRVPEAVLHGLAVAGGSLGAYVGMRWFRHKTIKGSFRIFFWCVVVMQMLLAVVVLWRIWRG